VSTPSSSSEFTSSSLLLSSPVSIASVSTYQRGTTSVPSTVTTTSYPQPTSNATSSQCSSVSKFIFTESQIVTTSNSTSIACSLSSSEFTSSHISVSSPIYSANLSPKVSNQTQKEEKFICLNKVVMCLFIYFDYTG